MIMKSINDGKNFRVVTGSPRETKKLAQKIFQENKKELRNRCLIFALQGELGTGKTQLAKGLGRALGIKETIVSPSFTLIREYPFEVGGRRGIFYHLDAWLIETAEEWLALDVRGLIKPGNVVAIEWPEKGRETWDKIFDSLAVKVVWVNLEHQGKGERIISQPRRLGGPE